VRWWDGTNWTGHVSGPGAQAGVWAPNPVQRVDWSNQAWSNDPAGDCNSALIAHLLAMLAGILGVGIFYALTKERSQFVRHHATEALNFTITLMIVTFVVPLGLFMLIGGAMLVLGERAAVGSFFGFFLIFPVVGVVSLAALILPIMAMMAAGRGEWYRYPAIFRFVSGPIEPHSG